MKIRVLFILMGLGGEVSAGKLPWLDAGMDRINVGIVQHKKQQGLLAEGDDLPTHEEKLIPHALKRMEKIRPYIPDAHKEDFSRTNRRLRAVIDHRALSWDIYVALHLQLAKLLTTAFTPFASRSGYTRFGPYIDSWNEDIVSIEHMGAFLRRNRAFNGQLMVLPLFAKRAEDALLGVKTLNKAFAHGVIPIILVPEAPDVHGGMLPTPFDFMIHDWAHGYYFWKEFFSHPVLRVQLPTIQGLLERHTGKKREVLKFQAQLILYLHEWSAHIYGQRLSGMWESAGAYYAHGKTVLESYINVTLEAAEEKLANKCLQEAIRNAESGLIESSLMPVEFEGFRHTGEGCLSTLTVENLLGAKTDVIMRAEFSRNTDEIGYPVAICCLCPLQDTLILGQKPEVLKYKLQGDDYVLHRKAFRDLSELLKQIGALPSTQRPLREPVLGPELWGYLEAFMSDFNPELFTPSVKGPANVQ